MKAAIVACAMILAGSGDRLLRLEAIIGGVGPAGFYERAVGATLIPGSEKGIYRNRLAPLEPNA